MASFQSGKMQRRFLKYTWKVVFVLSSRVRAASRMLKEPIEAGYNCNFLKNFKKWDFIQDILDYITSYSLLVG